MYELVVIFTIVTGGPHDSMVVHGDTMYSSMVDCKKAAQTVIQEDGVSTDGQNIGVAFTCLPSEKQPEPKPQDEFK